MVHYFRSIFEVWIPAHSNAGILKSGPLLQSLALTLIKHLSLLIRVFMIIRKSQVGEFDQGWS